MNAVSVQTQDNKQYLRPFGLKLSGPRGHKISVIFINFTTHRQMRPPLQYISLSHVKDSRTCKGFTYV